MTDFNSIKHKDERGKDFWYLSELLGLFGEEHYGIRSVLIESHARIDCILRHFNSGKHFHETEDDVMLSRCACFLIAKNADAEKQAVQDALSFFSGGYELCNFFSTSKSIAIGMAIVLGFTILSHWDCCIK